ncbi:unnamed protein product [Laminaria digitata]
MQAAPLLMALCFSPDVCVEVVRLLLEAGADAALASEHEITPLNMMAAHSDTRMVDILHTEAPATLNRCSSNGMTPLYSACKKGHEGHGVQAVVTGSDAAAGF